MWVYSCVCVCVCATFPPGPRAREVSRLVRHVQVSKHRPDFGFDAVFWDS